MSKNVERILLACLLSYVGIQIAKQFEIFWWIGMVAGFAIGYIGHDVRGFLQAVPEALRKARGEKEASAPTKGERFARFLRCSFYTIGAWASIGLTVFVIPCISLGGSESFLTPLSIYVADWIPLTLFIFRPRSLSKEDVDWHIEEMSDAIRWMHPIPFVIRSIPLGIFHALRAVAWGTENVSALVGRFAWHLFRLVHSNERVLFGIDVAMGVAVFHYSGNNELLGTLAGGLWWILDWHLISIKLMKVQPAKPTT